MQKVQNDFSGTPGNFTPKIGDRVRDNFLGHTGEVKSVVESYDSLFGHEITVFVRWNDPCGTGRNPMTIVSPARLSKV